MADVVGQPQLSPQADEANHDRTPASQYHLAHDHDGNKQDAVAENEERLAADGSGIVAVAARPGKIELTKVTIPGEAPGPASAAPGAAPAATVAVVSSKADGGTCVVWCGLGWVGLGKPALWSCQYNKPTTHVRTHAHH